MGEADNILREDERLRTKGRHLRHLGDRQVEDKVPGEERLRRLKEMLPAGLEPSQAMKILSSYLQTLETTFDDYRKASDLERRQLESDCRALTKNNDDNKQEMERLTADLLELTGTLEEQESLLSTANQKAASFEKQFKKSHRENGELSNKLTQKENDAIFYRQELDRSVQENEAATAMLATANARLDDLERRLAQEKDNAGLHEKEARRLGMALAESQNKNAITERKMAELAIKYNDEIKRLSDRSNADAQHEVSLLRKRIRSGVAPELRELQQLMNIKLSLESASNFKALILRLLSKLEQAGLELK